MSEEIYALLAGLKIAIYLSVLVMAFIVDRVEKRKSVHGLNIMALAFMLIALIEFSHTFAHIEGIWEWLTEHENLHLLLQPLFTIGGIGIIIYLRGLNCNAADY
jgi:hypothetical protein